MITLIEKWKELSRETVFQKYGRAVEKVIYKTQDGSEHDFYIKKEGDAVGILALTKDQQVILVQQYRPGPDEILTDVPSGYIDKNESPAQAAARELLEETGYAGEILPVATSVVDAYATTKRHCFVAINCEKIAEPTPDGTEFLNVILMPLSDYRKLLKKGLSTFYPAGYVGLDHLGLL